ncbi:MAG: response regulator [Anaerolineales bacterium]|nr:response regulator [Anaerolineales bacterium]
MFQLFLTPASVSYLTQFILSLAITVFLINRLRSRRTRSLFLLTAFFVPMTALTGLMILDAALLPFPRVLPAYAENTVLALALTVMIWFAYQFPERYPQRKWEMRILLTLSLVFLLWEAGFMVYRYVSILRDGNAFNRFPLDAYSLPVVVLFVPFAFLRQTLAADPRPIAWWRKLWKPAGKDARGARNFVLIFAVPVVVGIISVLLNFGLPFEYFNAAMSIGILVMLWLFVNNYVNFIPGSVNVTARLSILILTLFLALIGMIGWLIAPSHIAAFHPNLLDYQTLRFTPNATGGYDVSEVDFHFERALGEKVGAQTLDENGNQQVAFTFPFYGETYTEVYITHSGAISIGEPFRPLNLQAAIARVPTLFPLKISLTPNPADEDSGLYIRREPEQLIITWNRMLADGPETRYTFQSILYADGSFEFTNNGLPQPILFSADSTPGLRGVVAGRGEPLHEPPAGMEDGADLVAISRAGATPLLENYQLAFRSYLHTFMLPVAWVIIGGSLLLLLIVPLVLRASITRPIEALAAGVQRMEAGEMDITVPVQTEDEIGFLTGAFNTMSDTIDDLVHNLETRVADRTRELDDANASLRVEMLQREAAQDQLLQQQRTVAAFEERERLARELHDGIGQTLGYINMQAEATRELINQGDRESVSQILARLAEVAREAHGDLRGYIQNLKSETLAATEGFFPALERYCQHLRQAYLFDVTLASPNRLPDPLASAQVETHLTYIIREALSNARRYSGQNQAAVLLEADDQTVQAVIEDQGVGMPVSYTGPERRVRAHFGLRIMRERVDEMGGTLSIETEAGKGTRVIVRLPRGLALGALSQLSVVIVDDHPLFTDGLRNMLTARGAQVVGLAKDGLEAQEVVRALKPDLILMDVNMPRLNGLEATRRITAEMPEAKIVMLTTSASEADLFEALRSGAVGYLLKGMSAGKFFATLGGIVHGETEFSAEMAQRILAEFPFTEAAREPNAAPEQAVEHDVLTDRQMEILRLVANGLMYQEIAERLFVTERTVKYHMGEILARLQLKGRRAAEEYAKRRGIR